MRLAMIGLGAAAIAAGACGDDGGPATIDAPAPDAVATDARVCRVMADGGGPGFGASVAISEPGNGSFVPAIAARDGRVVIAWHDFPAGGGPSRIATSTIVDGCVGPLEVLAEPLAGPKRPTLAATASGFVLAWEVVDAGTSVIRTIDLDADGRAIGAPTTVSAPGAVAVMPRVAARGDDVVWTWTDGAAHHFARRGPVETVAASPVGTTLLSGGQLNFPRLAIGADGTLFLAYRDGADSAEWEVLLMIRAVGGSFLGPLNVSRSPGLLSDDVALAMEPDDTLDIVWVDQDPVDVNSFEVTHATRTPAGFIGAPARFGTQGEWAWTPSVTPGMSAVWHTGAGAGGALWLAPGPTAAPEAILPGEQGSMVALARDGGLHLAFMDTATPRQVHYARRP